ncbi:MAG: hypothetical protein J0M20_16370 [Burkholderiales bacterium]|nr:hypothetical protein [Burkholderiales bacterium]
MDPHPGDKHAKLLSRWNEIERTEPSPAQLLDAHAAQGAPVTDYVLQLETIKRHAGEFSAFTSENQLEGLLELAAYSAQWNPAAPGASLRALRECVSLGRCGQKPEELDLTFYDLPPGSPQHAKAIEMIPRVRELMRL